MPRHVFYGVFTCKRLACDTADVACTRVDCEVSEVQVFDICSDAEHIEHTHVFRAVEAHNIEVLDDVTATVVSACKSVIAGFEDTSDCHCDVAHADLEEVVDERVVLAIAPLFVDIRIGIYVVHTEETVEHLDIRLRKRAVDIAYLLEGRVLFHFARARGRCVITPSVILVFVEEYDMFSTLFRFEPQEVFIPRCHCFRNAFGTIERRTRIVFRIAYQRVPRDRGVDDLVKFGISAICTHPPIIRCDEQGRKRAYLERVVVRFHEVTYRENGLVGHIVVELLAVYACYGCGQFRTVCTTSYDGVLLVNLGCSVGLSVFGHPAVLDFHLNARRQIYCHNRRPFFVVRAVRIGITLRGVAVLDLVGLDGDFDSDCLTAFASVFVLRVLRVIDGYRRFGRADCARHRFTIGIDHFEIVVGGFSAVVYVLDAEFECFVQVVVFDILVGCGASDICAVAFIDIIDVSVEGASVCADFYVFCQNFDNARLFRTREIADCKAFTETVSLASIALLAVDCAVCTAVIDADIAVFVFRKRPRRSAVSQPIESYGYRCGSDRAYQHVFDCTFVRIVGVVRRFERITNSYADISADVLVKIRCGDIECRRTETMVSLVG